MRGESTESLVIVFPGALGDFLLALPALRTLRARHAGLRATLVVKDALRGLVDLAAFVDATVALEDAATATLFAGERLPGWLDGRPHVYSWLGADDVDLRARVAHAARSAHFFKVERGDAPVHAALAYARAVRGPTTLRALAGASALSVPSSAPADRLLAQLVPPVLAVHPGAGARSKRWDVAGFVQVAHWWRAAGGSVAVITGPAEAGEPPSLGGAEVREWALPELAAVLSRAALYVGNDSGVSHLAGAVGAAGVVLYGPTDPRRWRPLGGRLVVLRAPTSGSQPIPLSLLPAARVVAACRRRFALTRRDPDTSVRTNRFIERS